ncbi:WD domain, G-beta repeat-containing protein [Toxoplasma gondii MAS]|uniref:WD domain, G-beta repeat-containing protein n=1 Tax=Toxoplasma gondii MAS TaxID=943118 RepID=A0A086QSA0_TOXGO|nr:WD domain, G-beta repeat-containing protein [Toxoplasma gondii MAS]
MPCLSCLDVQSCVSSRLPPAEGLLLLLFSVRVCFSFGCTEGCSVTHHAQNRQDPLLVHVSLFFCLFPLLKAVLRVKPKDQLQLSPEELRKRMPPRILYPQNPRAPKNLALYSFKEKVFKRDEQIDQTVFHLSVDGALLHAESQEAIEQEEAWRLREEEDAKKKRKESVDIRIEDDLQQNTEDEGRVLRNQFNYGDRASQTETKADR